MANFSSSHKPSSLNLDVSHKYLNPSQSFFLLNHDVTTILGKAIPMNANHQLCDLELPGGENYAPNTYYSPLTNESYTWHYNSNGVHFISVVNGEGECRIVYNGNCLQLSADPKHQITHFRAHLHLDYLCNKVPGGKLKELVWVDGTDTPSGMIDVEAAIATNFFTTPFFDLCPDECAYLQLCVPEPKGCLVGEFVPFDVVDIDKSNKLLDKGFKFMYQHVYYDNRRSEWSDRSGLYYQDSKGCFDSPEGFSRCIKFRIHVGNPLVDRINFAFSEDGGITWYLSETIEKYKKYNSSQQYWYERELSELVSGTFDESDCAFDYLFCNDKQRVPIDPLDVSRVGNFEPREVQALLSMPKGALGFVNYVKGFCPIDKNEAGKFDIDIVCNDAASSCDTEIVEITVRAIVHNNYFNRNGFIYRMGGGAGVADDDTDDAWFGVTAFAPSTTISHGYNQTFKDKTRNFIVVIAGTEYWAEMTQWRSTENFNSRKKVGVLAGMDDELTVAGLHSDITNGNFYYQEAIIKAPKGTKGFLQLISHHQTSGIGSNQDTSTQVIGIAGTLTNYHGTTTFGDLDPNIKEIYFDTCDGNVTLDQNFVVQDLFVKSGLFGGNQSSAYNGYITDKNNQPVEGAMIYKSGGGYYTTTDHNGFYAFYKYDGTSDAVGVDVYVEQDCDGDFAAIESFSVQSDTGQIADIDYQIQSVSYRDGLFANINVPVVDCNDVPVIGVRVAISGSKYKITGSDGIARFKVRNYNSRNRSVVAVVMDKGHCFTFDCDNNCNPCLPATISKLLLPCFVSEPTYIMSPTTKVNTANLLTERSGLKSGGRYPFGFVAEGDCGILSAVNEVKYIDIPRTQDKNSLSFCSFTYNANNITLPDGVKRLKIVRGANLNPYHLQWVVDEIERTSDGKIKLTIQSLNDYNANHFFKTNTVYQYLQGDRVEFIRNGDGKIFTTAVNGVLNYLTLSPFHDEAISGETDAPADFFNQLLIQDDGKLDGLTVGAIIEIQSPAIATNEITYFEICTTLSVDENGQVEIQTGTFNTFDTFLVSRQIEKFPAQYFEHKSPSDFWGGDNGLSDVGKAHFLNKFENERRYGRNITINAPNVYNFFEGGVLEKTFGAAEHGDIIAISLKDEKIGLALGENDNFLFQVGDDLLRVGSDNIIRAMPADNLISDPEPKLRGQFGCGYADIGSVFFGDAYALWIDSKHDGYIIHNYSYAKKAGESVSQDGQIISQCNSYFRKRIREKENFNRTSTDFLNHFRWSTGINKNNGAVYLTLKSLRHSGINNSKAVYELANETIAYHPDTDTFLTMTSFTPEAYSQLNLNDEKGCAFLVYQNSIPYIHPVIADKYNEFFGVAVDQIVGITVNAGKKIVIPLSIEVQSKAMFFVPEGGVTTDNPDFISEIPAVRFKNVNAKWNAAFLNDVNSRGGLYNGTAARSYYVNVLFVKDNTIDNQYSSVNNAKKISYNELDQILIKFMVSEQSGFDQNL